MEIGLGAFLKTYPGLAQFFIGEDRGVFQVVNRATRSNRALQFYIFKQGDSVLAHGTSVDAIMPEIARINARSAEVTQK